MDGVAAANGGRAGEKKRPWRRPNRARVFRFNSTFFSFLPNKQDEEVRLVIEECHEHYALMREIFG